MRGGERAIPNLKQFVDELARALDDAQTGANRAKSSTPWGSSKVIVTDGGGVNLPPTSDQTQTMFQVTTPDGIPRPWIISLAGEIQQRSQTALLTYPFTKFTVQFGSAGALETTEVDGFSDQFLMVFGNQVTVTCSIDTFNAQLAALFVPAGLHLQYPKSTLLKGSASLSDGARTAAKRTFVVPPVGFPGPDTLLPIPYAATGVILRTPETPPAQWLDPVTGAKLVWETAQGITQDIYTAAEVAAAHGRGEYMSVPSMSDLLRVTQPTGGPPSTLAFIEFLMQP